MTFGLSKRQLPTSSLPDGKDKHTKQNTSLACNYLNNLERLHWQSIHIHRHWRLLHKSSLLQLMFSSPASLQLVTPRKGLIPSTKKKKEREKGAVFIQYITVIIHSFSFFLYKWLLWAVFGANVNVDELAFVITSWQQDCDHSAPNLNLHFYPRPQFMREDGETDPAELFLLFPLGVGRKNMC